MQILGVTRLLGDIIQRFRPYEINEEQQPQGDKPIIDEERDTYKIRLPYRSLTVHEYHSLMKLGLVKNNAPLQFT